MDFWVLNTDEAEKEGIGADRKMIQMSRVAAWKDPSEGPGWALSKLSKPEAGDRVFLYKKGTGIIAMATFDNSDTFPSNDIFGLLHKGEFNRRVIDLKPSPRCLTCSVIEENTGKSFRPLSTMFRIKIPEIIEFLSLTFDKS